MHACHRLLPFAIAVLLAAVSAPDAFAQSAGGSITTLNITIPFAAMSEDVAATQDELDAATAEALETEGAINALDAENIALMERIAVTDERIAAQEVLVAESTVNLIAAKDRLNIHVVSMYKRGSFDSLSVLLSSDDMSTLVARANALLHIADEGNQLVGDLNVALSEARYQQGELDTLQSQNEALQIEQEARLAELEQLLVEQEARVAALTEEARQVLLQARSLNASTRAQWRAASIPVGTDIPWATATVVGRPGVTYGIPAYMPRSYSSIGQTSTAVCSWYGPGFNGRPTASGQTFNQDDYTCASRTLPLGTVLALTRGSHRIIVYVNDRGPYISGRDLDLSMAAAQALGFSGVASVQAEIVVPTE
jgi:rare lipoprotein A